MLANIEIADELLEKMRITLGTDFDRYRNHVYRVINFTNEFLPLKDDSLQQVAIAACFHDAGIWLDHTFDYLQPSRVRADEFLRSQGCSDWSNTISAMIMNHHRVRPVRSNLLVEAFRRADWIDVSQGLVSFGLGKDVIAPLLIAYPTLGFHARMAWLTVRQARRHPTNPLPMMRW
jgi:hypothetical protein